MQIRSGTMATAWSSTLATRFSFWKSICISDPDEPAPRIASRSRAEARGRAPLDLRDAS
jgi:hypothetical protein